MPNAGVLGLVRSGISVSEATFSGSSSHFTASKPELTPQYGDVSDEARL